MDKKYRIKKFNHINDPQNQSLKTYSPLKTNTKLYQFTSNNQNKFKSQLIKPTYQISPQIRAKFNKQFIPLGRQTFSKLKPISFSPQLINQNRSRSKTVPQNKKNHYNMKNDKSLSPRHEKNCLNDQKQLQQMSKFPYYVSKSHKMIQMKQKLLQMKHHIKLNHQCPILQSIQDSINVDKTGFTRKMKLQLYRKGNYDLLSLLYKDNHHSECKQKSKQKSNDKNKQKSNDKSRQKSKQKSKQRYIRRDINLLMSMQYKDQIVIQKRQRIKKMQQIKKNLKTVRKNNLKHIK